MNETEKNPASKSAPPATHSRVPLVLLGCVVAGLIILSVITVVSRRKASGELVRETKENSMPTVSVVHPRHAPLDVDVQLPGNIQAFEEAPLYARVNGYLKRWVTDIGSHVKAGDLLAEIETPELDQELNQARAALAQANANLEIARISSERWQTLRKSDSVSQQDTDVRVATWHAREADVNAEKANVQRLTELTNFKQIVAPFDGIITVRTVDVGTLITAGSSREIFRLAKIDPLRVYISLPQAYSQMVKPDDEAVLTFSELPGQKFVGKVIRTAGAIDPISRTLLTEVQVSNKEGKLFPGAHAMVDIKLANHENPVVVPINTLLFRDAKGVQVGLVDSNGVVSLASVTIGNDYGTTVEIVHGLKASDNVIINPSDSLEPGTQVRVSQLQSDEPKAKHE